MDSGAEAAGHTVGRRSVIKGSTALWLTPTVVSVAAVATAMGSGSQPVITSTTNVNILDPAPPTFKRNQIESDTDGYVFLESLCAPLGTDIVVNRATDGNFGGASNAGTVIPAGTLVSTFILGFDRLSPGMIVGTVSFSNPILGLIYRRDEFLASTPEFAASGVCYPVNNGSYFENSDSGTLAGDTVQINSTVNANHSDVVRILVAC